MSTLAAPRTIRERLDRWSLLVFVVVVVLAVPLLLYLGRDQWFFLDEWWVLGEGSDSLTGYFDAHNGHWSTVVTVVFDVNYAIWGLHTYLPYQVPVVLAHVGSAVFVRVLMRQLGVRGWIATPAALIFVFFGSGSLNIFFGFQISQAGSLFCGLAYFALANREGPLDGRDWLALVVGLVGLTTSGIFVAMVVGVGLAVLLRRGLVAATFYTVPLAVVYGVWYMLYGREDSVLSFSAPREAVRFVFRMLGATFTSLAGSDVGGIALGLVVVGTLAVVVVAAVRTRQWTPVALPAGLLTAWVTFASLTALARASAFGAESGESDRYLHISAALFLPLIALGAEYLARQNMIAGALPVLLLVAGLPGNIDALANRDPFTLGNRNQIVWLAHSEYINDVPADREPIVTGGIQLPITAGWLAREAEAGDIPEPDGDDPRQQLNAYARLALRQEMDDRKRPQCPRAPRQPVELDLAVGERIVFQNEIQVTIREGRNVSHPLMFRNAQGASIVAELGPLALVVRGTDGGAPRLCEPTRTTSAG